jgi:hypothetical protein
VNVSTCDPHSHQKSMACVKGLGVFGGHGQGSGENLLPLSLLVCGFISISSHEIDLRSLMLIQGQLT